MSDAGARDRLHFWSALGAIVLLGLALRIGSAQGALWLDEAWSARLARDAGTPLGIFLNINHDNNHHLNSLWLQLVGYGAPPPLARAFSIVTSSIAIPVAGAIGARHGPLHALVFALLVAVSPALVTLGSEARGYAPMMLALLTAILLADRWLAGRARSNPSVALALTFFLGALSQLTMFFGFCAVAGWVFFALWKRSGFVPALREALRLFAPSFVALALVVGIVLGAATASPTGFQFGGYDDFTLLLFLHGVIELLGYSVGLPFKSLWWAAAAPILVILAPSFGVTRLALYRLAIVAFPVTLALLQSANVGHPRYYLLAGIGLLLMLGEMIATGLAQGGWRRIAAAGALAVVFAGSLWHDAVLIANRRGDADAAIRALQTRAPEGTRVRLERDIGDPILSYAAADANFRLEIVHTPCPPARFLFIDAFKGETMPRIARSCGRTYAPIATAQAHGMSGTHWTLYELRP